MLLEFPKRRIEAFLEEIRKLRGSDFPYPHSETALKIIESVFEEHLAYLQTLDDQSDIETVQAARAATAAALFDYLPYVGFLLRSTNVRNSFEIYGPLLRLGRQLLGTETNLVLSSEWEYSPVTYFSISSLQNFVFVGLPSPESENPLLIPLAGHELGHSLWAKKLLFEKTVPRLKNIVLQEIRNVYWNQYSKFYPAYVADRLDKDLLAIQTWTPCVRTALSQSEESFCDIVGLCIFGQSYLYAFSYLLSPNIGGRRSSQYPNMNRRARDLVAASNTFDIEVPDGYLSLFEDSPEASDVELYRFWQQLADEAASTLFSELLSLADSELTAAGVRPILDSEESRALFKKERTAAEQTILKKIHLVSPASKAGSLPDILNAAWQAFQDTSLWEDHPQIRSKDRTLKDIILKSVECLEIEELLRQP